MLLSVLSSASLPRSRNDTPLYLLDDRPALETDHGIKKKTIFTCCSAPSTRDVDSDAWAKLRLIEVHTSSRLMVQISVDGSNRSDYTSLQSKSTQDSIAPECPFPSWRQPQLHASSSEATLPSTSTSHSSHAASNLPLTKRCRLQAYWHDHQPGILLLGSSIIPRGGGGEQAQWHWQALRVSPRFESVAALGANREPPLPPSPPSSPPDKEHPSTLSPSTSSSPPKLTSILIECHPKGDLIAAVLGDAEGRSCILFLALYENKPLWPIRHLLWCNYEAEGRDPFLPLLGVKWMAGTRYLAVVDSCDHLAIVDHTGSLVQIKIAKASDDDHEGRRALGSGLEMEGGMVSYGPLHHVSYSSLLDLALQGMSRSSITAGKGEKRERGRERDEQAANQGRPLYSLHCLPLPSPPLIGKDKGPSRSSASPQLLAVSDGRNLLLLRYQPPTSFLTPFLVLNTFSISPGQSPEPKSFAFGFSSPANITTMLGGERAREQQGQGQEEGEGGVDSGTILSSSVGPTSGGSSSRATGASYRFPPPTAGELVPNPNPHGTPRSPSPLHVSTFPAAAALTLMTLSGRRSQPNPQLSNFGRETHQVLNSNLPPTTPSRMLTVPPSPLAATLVMSSKRHKRGLDGLGLGSHGTPSGALSSGPLSLPSPLLREQGQGQGGMSHPAPDPHPAPYSHPGGSSEKICMGGWPVVQHKTFLHAFAPSQESTMMKKGSVKLVAGSMHKRSSFASTAGIGGGGAGAGGGVEASEGSMTSNASTGWSLYGHSSALPQVQEEGLGQGAESSPPPLSPSPSPSPFFLVSSYCQSRLLRGAEALMEGRTKAALGHYSKAKVFGLLPCILILVHKLQVKPCVDIIRAVSHSIAPHLSSSSSSSPSSFEDECEQAIISVLSLVDLDSEEEPFTEAKGLDEDDEDEGGQEGELGLRSESSSLLRACLIQLALGCHVLSFLSFRLHVHAGLMMAHQQLTASATIASPKSTRPGHDWSGSKIPLVRKDPSFAFPLSPSRLGLGLGLGLGSPSIGRASGGVAGSMNSLMRRSSVAVLRSPFATLPSSMAAYAAIAGSTPKGKGTNPNLPPNLSPRGRSHDQEERHLGGNPLTSLPPPLIIGVPMAVVWHPVLPTKLPNSSTSTSTPPQSSAAANEGGDNGGGGGRRFTLGLYHLALDVTKLAMEEEWKVGGERRGVGQGPKPPPPPPPPLSNASHKESKSPERHSPPSARSSLTINVNYKSKHARSGSQDRSSAARAAQAALSAILSVDNPSLEVKGPKGDLEEVAGSSLGQFTEPGFATGLLLMAYACENKTLRLGGLEASAAGGGGTSSSSSLGLRNVRVNWKLLRDSPPLAQGAALWRSLGDWRKASCLAFTVHQLMRKVGGLGGVGGEGEAACLHMGLSILRQQVARCHAMEVQEACITLHELVAIPRHVLGHKSAVYALMMRKVCNKLADLLPKRFGITPLLPELASNPASLLLVSHQDVRVQLRAQLSRCIAKVCAEVHLSLGCSGSRDASGDAIEVIKALFSDPEAEACIKMLLRWQGCYNSINMARSLQAVAEGAGIEDDGHFFADTTDDDCLSLLSTLRRALEPSNLIPTLDLEVAMDQAELILAAETDDTPFLFRQSSSVYMHYNPVASPSISMGGAAPSGNAARSTGGGGRGDVSPPPAPSAAASSFDEANLVGLNDLSLMIDFAQIGGTLLACMHPHISDSLPMLEAFVSDLPNNNAVGGGGRKSGSQGGGGEPQRNASTKTSNRDSFSGMANHKTEGLSGPDADEASTQEVCMAVCDLIKQLMALDWALVCRTHVAALLAQLRSFSSNQQHQDLLHFMAPQGPSGGSQSIKPSSRADGSQGEGDKRGGSVAKLKAKAKASMAHFSFTAKRHSFTKERRLPSTAEIEKQERAHLLLLRWCAALILADRFHVDTELQATIHKALSSIVVSTPPPSAGGEMEEGHISDRSTFTEVLHPPPPPLVLVSLVENALRKRNLFNARLAEQINRLKPKAVHASTGLEGKSLNETELGGQPSVASLGSRTFHRQASENTKADSSPDESILDPSAVQREIHRSLLKALGSYSTSHSTSTAQPHHHSQGGGGELMKPRERSQGGGDARRSGGGDARRSGGGAKPPVILEGSEEGSGQLPSPNTASHEASTLNPRSQISLSGLGMPKPQSSSGRYPSSHPPPRTFRHRSLLLSVIDTLSQAPAHFTGGEAVTDALGGLLRQDLGECFVHPLGSREKESSEGVGATADGGEAATSSDGPRGEWLSSDDMKGVRKDLERLLDSNRWIEIDPSSSSQPLARAESRGAHARLLFPHQESRAGAISAASPEREGDETVVLDPAPLALLATKRMPSRRLSPSFALREEADAPPDELHQEEDGHGHSHQEEEEDVEAEEDARVDPEFSLAEIKSKRSEPFEMTTSPSPPALPPAPAPSPHPLTRLKEVSTSDGNESQEHCPVISTEVKLTDFFFENNTPSPPPHALIASFLRPSTSMGPESASSDPYPSEAPPSAPVAASSAVLSLQTLSKSSPARMASSKASKAATGVSSSASTRVGSKPLVVSTLSRASVSFLHNNDASSTKSAIPPRPPTQQAKPNAKPAASSATLAAPTASSLARLKEKQKGESSPGSNNPLFSSRFK